MRARETAIIAALLLSVTACVSSPPSPAPDKTAPSPSNRYGAPIVASPRDISAYQTRPCDLLSTSERVRLDLPGPPRQRTSIDVQECSWTTTNDGELAMAVNAHRDLLADTYRTRLMRIFVPTTVDGGLPAVRQRMTLNDNTCTVTVGIGPAQALETEWSGPIAEQTRDPCEQAEKAIALVIPKLPPSK